MGKLLRERVQWTGNLLMYALDLALSLMGILTVQTAIALTGVAVGGTIYLSRKAPSELDYWEGVQDGSELVLKTQGASRNRRATDVRAV